MHAELKISYPIRYQFNGLGYKFGKKGGVDYFNTWWHGDVPRFLNEVQSLNLSSYDLVISDFEPISAWAARKQHVPCVGLSNQCTLLDERIPKPDNRRNKYKFARYVLKNYAPVDYCYGFHYENLSENIFNPIIRREVRDLHISNDNHYVVYLPFFHDRKIIKALSHFRGQKWIVFSKHSKKYYRERNIDILPISDTRFTEELAAAKGIICGAGFGLTSEALFLGKKLLVIPMKNQFEQLCNALSLNELGVVTIKSLKPKWRSTIQAWLESDSAVQMHYPDQTQVIVDKILSDFAQQLAVYHESINEYGKSYNKL
jgi:uncharacterized protein (TIGR00661 family)